ncbi:P-loop containing nucleoside triphosphate hydrolase protein [Xylona heveae TC161]|uniref:RNA helicase n=1 Tax=Xylona heveae (strain CBS 132557 / TC161) TaxID=1328760 RepID=A0A165FTA0_XYLHT|nr:P-loop containing nucleoside triphosphate hydrolase protein [Xylona heveae TC161]KZF21350.1 P-loop containing nucleoside triphosphate hydrolase protein [Xylona heveae TC161]
MPKFVPRQRKQKARQRQAAEEAAAASAIAARNTGNGISAGAGEDSNAAELAPESKSVRDERRRQLREELRSQQSSKITTKKQKRLDKYIDNKLKKEENLELIKKLADAKVDTSLFRSARSLGGKTESKRDVLSRAMREKRAGIDVEKNDAILLTPLRQPEAPQEEPASDSESVQSEGSADSSQQAPVNQKTEEKPSNQIVQPPPAVAGSGLKRALDVGDDGNPIIKKRKKRQPLKPIKPVVEPTVEPEWEGFDSESGSESEGDVSASKDGESEGAESSSEEGEEEGDEVDAESEDSGSGSEGSESEEEEEDDDDDVEEDDSEEESEEGDTQQRSSAFKAWAMQQRNEALGFTPSAKPEDEAQLPEHTISINFTPREVESDPLPPELETKTVTDAYRKSYSVPVERSEELQEARLKLPIVAEEQKIMEAIHNNPTIVVWGSTGSGKTTQVPQFLYEAGYGSPDGPTPGMIGVTQPRRVAAVSMAKRVGDELGKDANKVAYQIRFESTVADGTAIKFMTDGVLLREVAQDFALTKYSAIVIDEAHERSVNTDILIGMMSRIVDLRETMARENPKVKPLKLIIMSATLRISDFTENKALFRAGPPPLLQAEGRQYPVTMHFSRRTHRDYLDEAFKKISRGHRKLPPGAMLVFLTGQNEIKTLSKKLRQAFPSTTDGNISGPSVRLSANEVPLETEDIELGDYQKPLVDEEDSGSEPEITGLDEEEDEFDIGEKPESPLKVHVLPLYSQLPTNQQLRVFETPPEGSRLIVLATNVAETSLTIPGVKYVFDCGRSKEKKYDRATGVQSFEIGWISKASASQRAGRAGRTGPGHCYRLYSSAVFERDFDEYAEPEILRMPIEGVVLQLKSMELSNVINFPFPTPPDRPSLAKAEKLLTYLGALDPEGKITPLGRELSIYPLSPRFAKMLSLGHSHNCTAYAVALVASLAVPDLFIPENQLDLHTPAKANGEDDNDDTKVWTQADSIAETARAQRRKAYNAAHHQLSNLAPTSDALKLLSAVCAYAYSPHPEAFCDSMFLRAKALAEAAQLRPQLTNILRAAHPPSSSASPSTSYTPRLPQATPKQLALLRQIITAAFIDHVAQRADMTSSSSSASDSSSLPYRRKPTRATDVAYLPLFPVHRGRYSSSSSSQHASSGGDGEVELDPYIYIHPSSVLSHTSPKEMPQYIIYSHLQRSTPSREGKAPRTRMFPLTPTTGPILAALAQNTPLVEYSKPIAGKIEPFVSGSGPVSGGSARSTSGGKGIGEDGKERRICWVIPSLTPGPGSLGWPLPARKVVQRRDGTRGWVVERVIQG